MTMSREQRIRRHSIAVKKRVLCRWKVAEISIDGNAHNKFRAICGVENCRGSLGLLRNVAWFEDGLSTSTRLNRSYVRLTRHAARVESIPELNSTMRDLVESMEAVIANAQAGGFSRFDEQIEEIRSRSPISDHEPDRVPKWIIDAEPSSESYHAYFDGFPDTGFTIREVISNRRGATRGGRRPRGFARDFRIAEQESLGLDPRRQIAGALAALPCEIFCRVCGRLNAVDLPDDVRKI